MNRPDFATILEYMKPITWFAPMWAFGCGLISSGFSFGSNWQIVVAGVLLAGPMVCGTSQAVNDWYDRHVDAINEPNRPIPSGRLPGNWGFYISVTWTILSLILATTLGFWGFAAATLGLILAWMYSAPPFRLKQNGWWGNLACGLAYEGLPWITAAAIIAAALPDWRILTMAALYSVGAHGIMTLNDFKSIEGDKRTGIGSLPVQLGPERAAKLACIVMAVPQIAVIVLLAWWGRPIHAFAVAGVLVAQVTLMRTLLSDPRGRAAWYNGTGIVLFVSGMMISAFAIRGLIAGAA
jgi:chlorophyll synthase